VALGDDGRGIKPTAAAMGEDCDHGEDRDEERGQEEGGHGGPSHARPSCQPVLARDVTVIMARSCGIDVWLSSSRSRLVPYHAGSSRAPPPAALVIEERS
jgi:hypothetical protein